MAMVTALVGGSSVAPAAAADGSPDIMIFGHGWGHGRGMGQYGAYGYAADSGWTSAQILDHYYGGTSAGVAPSSASVDPNRLRVELRFMRGTSTAVALGQGTLVLRGPDGAELDRIGSSAVRLRRVGNGYEVDTGPGCGGPWAGHSVLGEVASVRVAADSTAEGADGLLQVCGPSYRVWYRGEIQAAMDDAVPVTVNLVAVEQYLRGVVPNEMPASWPQAALESQVVAARSYVMAGDGRQQPYADTCETIRCQVYDGAYTERGGFRSASHGRTDAAIAATSGLVRLNSDGTVARTEFSSSTGGYTTGGAFPAVIDEGDAIAANPNHDWYRSVSPSTLEIRYGKGTFRSAEVIERNGLGADGGRVLQVELVFSQGSVTVSGSALRSILGLKSDWFSFGPGSASQVRQTDPGAYIDRSHQALVGRPATDDEVIRWVDTVSRGDRRALTNELVRSEHFVGLLLDDLYRRALGRGPDGPGRRYWIEGVAAGLDLRSIGVLFFGSPEYYQRAGGTDAGFVDALYRDILGRTPDAAGQRYWRERLAEDTVDVDDIVAGFYDSLESRITRAGGLHTMVLGPAPSSEATLTFAARLLSVDDITLAAEISASIEAYRA